MCIVCAVVNAQVEMKILGNVHKYNDVRRFLTIFYPHVPYTYIMSKEFYPKTSDFGGHFGSPYLP